MSRLILIRHCETNANVEGTVQGHQNLSLSERVGRQATLVGEYVHQEFSVNRIISSNRRRCTQTAKAIGPIVEVSPLLREIDWGDWEGKKWNDVKAEYPDDVTALLTADPNFSTPNGDSLMSFIERIDDAITELNLKNTDGDTIIVTHEGTVRTMITRLLGWDPSHMGNLVAFPGSVSIVTLEGNRRKLELLNHYEHLTSTYSEEIQN